MYRFAFYILLFNYSICFAQKTSVSINPNLIAYYGIDNQISINYTGVKPESLVLISNDTNYYKIVRKNSDFYIHPYYKFDENHCKIYIYRRKGKRLRLLDSFKIELYTLASGFASIGEREGKISLKKLKKCDSIYYSSNFHHPINNSYTITNYRILILPKNGNMSEIHCVNQVFNPSVRKLFDSCKIRDIIIFDNIRAKSSVFSYEKPLHPLTITLVEENGNVTEYKSLTRIEGFVKENGKTIPIIFPKSKNDEFPKSKVMDSIWIYYEYDNFLKDHILDKTLEFDEGKLMAITEYDGRKPLKAFTSKYINDSMCQFESYHPNGEIFQKGIVKLNTLHSEHRHFKFYRTINDLKLEHEIYLSKIPEDYSPMGYWIVNDSLGRLRMSINWAFVIDSSYQTECDFTDPEEPYISNIQIIPTNYYNVAKGECIYYKSDGSIEKRLEFE